MISYGTVFDLTGIIPLAKAAGVAYYILPAANY